MTPRAQFLVRFNRTGYNRVPMKHADLLKEFS